MKSFFTLTLISSLFFQMISFTSSAQGITCQGAVDIMPGNIQSDGPDDGNGCHNCSPGSPGGIPAEHADWFTYTPAEDGIISISSCNEGVDTRLWVYTGDCDNLVAYAGSDDACDMAPGEPYAALISNLPVAAGTTYFLEWDDAWDRSGFDFTLTFESVGTNVGVEPIPLSFTRIPLSIISQNGFNLNAKVVNKGTTTVPEALVTTKVFDEADQSSHVYIFQNDPLELDPGEMQTIQAGTWNTLYEGSFFIENSVRLVPDNDENPADDTTRTILFNITESEYGLDDDEIVGGLGIAGPGKLSQGQSFHFTVEDSIYSVVSNIQGGAVGDSLWVEVWSVDPLIGSPLNRLARSNGLALRSTDPEWLEIPLAQPFVVEAGSTYFFSLVHKATGTNIELGITENIYKPRNAWISVNDQSWTPLESLSDPGGGDAYEFAYSLRLRNTTELVELSFSVDMSEEIVATDSVFVVYSVNGGDEQKELLESGIDNVYTGSVNVPTLAIVHYRFVNGNPDNSGEFEMVPAECAFRDVHGHDARRANVRSEDVSTPRVCFGSCVICPPPPCDEPDLLICDDFERYNPGNLGPQSPHWSVWDGIGGEGTVTATRANSGTQSMEIKGLSNNGGPQDVLLLLGDSTSGRYSLRWNLFIPASSASYFNVQHELTPEHVWGIDVFFNSNGSGEVQSGVDVLETFTYSKDTWVEVNFILDIDNDMAQLFLNNEEITSWQFSMSTDEAGMPLSPSNQLAAINFFPLDQSYHFFVDDVYFERLEPVQTTVNAILQVDMSRFINNGGTVDAGGVKFAANYNNWEKQDMTDGGDGIWRFEGTLPVNSDIHYLFYNGDSEAEPVDSLADCGVADGAGGYYRLLETEMADIEVDTVCFGHCVACDEIVAINELANELQFRVFPNPVKTEVDILYKANHQVTPDFSLYNAFGTEVAAKKTTVSRGSAKLDMSALPDGVYWLKAFHGRQLIMVRKIVKVN